LDGGHRPSTRGQRGTDDRTSGQVRTNELAWLDRYSRVAAQAFRPSTGSSCQNRARRKPSLTLCWTRSFQESSLAGSLILQANPILEMMFSKGSAGVDRMTVGGITDYLKRHWPAIAPSV
jgi:hypothetical protein